MLPVSQERLGWRAQLLGRKRFALLTTVVPWLARTRKLAWMECRVKVVVVYYSKTGNTRKVAEALAQSVHAEALPLKLFEKGRRNRDEVAREKALWAKCISEAQAADLVFVGTPTEFRRPHPTVMKFLREAGLKTAAAFCTCYGMVGATLIDMEALLRQRRKQFMGGLAVRVGTDKYRFRKDVSQYVDRLTDVHLSEATAFGRRILRMRTPLAVRLQGVCGRDCGSCAKYKQGECEGAGVRCWSGRNCRFFDCCVIKRSLPECYKCPSFNSCGEVKRMLRRHPRA